jgi:hypothetical protein
VLAKLSAQDDQGAERELWKLEILKIKAARWSGWREPAAQLRRRQNRLDEARQLIGAAIETYESVGAKPLVARAQAELAADTATAD